jgi:uncharacterized protein (DUF2249 family)
MYDAEDASSGITQPGPQSAASTTPPATLGEEHALLMRELTARADPVLHEADEGRWPESQLRELLNYLHLEVLRQVTDTEWLLFRTTHQATEELARLRQDHLELRVAVDVLTQAAATAGGADGLSPRQLAAAIRDLLAQFDGHLTAEQQLLATAGTATPSTASLGSQPHEWYPLTEGPVIDLDQLPGAPGIDAAFSRLLRLAPHEQVELRSSSDPSPLWQRLFRTDPGGYGMTYLERGPRRWRLHITRRPAHSGVHPYS